ncbi:MAG: glycosyltransferase family 39 protein [Candidatus Aminicenantes bacterium]|nr:glycosyltransferase family 39 protein [Candidatus Aminicenantes bacterium]
MTRRSIVTVWGLIVFWGIALVLSFLSLSGFLMNDDEGTYLYAAWRVGLGEVPYRDFSLVQAPLSFYLGAAVFKIIGPSVWAARATDVLFMIGAAFLIFKTARRFFKMETGFALASAGIFLFNKHIFFLGRSFMPDVPMLFFGVAALYFALRGEEAGRTSERVRKDAFLVGLMAGLSALAKINGILVLAGYVSYLVFEGIRKRQSWREAAAKTGLAGAGFTLSFGIPFGLLLVFVPGTYDAMFGFHAAKEAVAGFTYTSLVLRRLVQTIGNHNYALAAGALAALCLDRSRRGNRSKTLLWMFAAATLVLAFVPSRFFLRYVVFAAAPAALLFGAGCEALAKRKNIGRIGLPILTILVLLCLGPTLSPRKILARDEGTRAAASFIRENTKPDDFVFGDEPFLNFLAQRPCPPQLVDVSEAMITSGRITTAGIVEECEKRAVKLIFVEKGASAHHLVKLKDYSGFRNYLRDRYRPATIIRREFLDVEFFLRSGD